MQRCGVATRPPHADTRRRKRFHGEGRLIKIKDVAEAAGVSPATVSRVLNGTGKVSPDRAERVRAVVAKLGYQPFSPARALRRQATDVWAVIVADIENPFFTLIVRGIEDGAQKRGFRVMLCNSDEDLQKEAAYIDVALAERMGGVVIAAASAKQSQIGPLLERGVPVVAIDRRPAERRSTASSSTTGSAPRRRHEHLIEAGARRVACITGPQRVSTANERLAGYRRRWQTAGRAFDPALVIGARTSARAAATTRRRRSSAWPSRPTRSSSRTT